MKCFYCGVRMVRGDMTLHPGSNLLNGRMVIEYSCPACCTSTNATFHNVHAQMGKDGRSIDLLMTPDNGRN